MLRHGFRHGGPGTRFTHGSSAGDGQTGLAAAEELSIIRDFM